MDARNKTVKNEPILEIDGVRKHFFGVVALDDVDINVRDREIVSLIGPNGSGKTTLFNCVTGFLMPDSGTIRFQGNNITGDQPHRIALRGISRTFQNVRIFPSLTVLQNLLVVAQQHQEDSIIRRFIRTPGIRRFEIDAQERADELIEFIELTHLRDQPAGTLSYGQRKLLEFARALLPDPDLVMLDEPTAAVNPTMIERMKRYIRRFNQTGKAIFIVEHNMDVVMDISHRVIVLDVGKKIAEGEPHAIQRNERVMEAYFGR